jgi:8-amino-7-oxononanoate synthase
MSSAWQQWADSQYDRLAERRLLRSLRTLTPLPGDGLSSVQVGPLTYQQLLDNTPSLGETEGGAGSVRAAGSGSTRLTIFAANDYLGLSAHPAVRRAAAAAALAHGSGPRGSALVCGYTHTHRELESALAALEQAEEALLLPTGYAANLAVMGAFADSPQCAIFSDELNHASIVDGARLAARGAGAALHVYRHSDLAHLEALLRRSDAPRKLIVSDALFSMDGDFADVRGLVRLKRAHGALLCLDEAHATLVCGERGGGLAEREGMAHEVDLHVGTLSKAFGSHGGFVACSRQHKQLLLTKGRPAVFSTALPMPAVAAAAAALQCATPELRSQLWQRVEAFGAASGLPAQSAIVPIVVGAEAAALDAGAALLRRGYWVPAIRPPTVPRGTARLRVALSAAHSEQEVLALAAAVRELGLLEQSTPAVGSSCDPPIVARL